MICFVPVYISVYVGVRACVRACYLHLGVSDAEFSSIILIFSRQRVRRILNASAQLSCFGERHDLYSSRHTLLCRTTDEKSEGAQSNVAKAELPLPNCSIQL